jgi:hypothetical protein
MASDVVRPPGLLASGGATAEVRGGSRVLRVRLQFMNPTAAPASLEIMSATCLVRILAYSSADRRVLRYDGVRDGAPCFDVARQLIVSPSTTEELVHEIQVSRSVANRLGANPYLVAVVEETRGAGFRSVDLGTIISR